MVRPRSWSSSSEDTNFDVRLELNFLAASLGDISQQNSLRSSSKIRSHFSKLNKSSDLQQLSTRDIDSQVNIISGEESDLFLPEDLVAERFSELVDTRAEMEDPLLGESAVVESSGSQGAAMTVRSTHLQHRNKFLSKLARSGIWETKHSSQVGSRKSVSLTIFDWDDTLFPTSAFTPKTEEEMLLIQQHNKPLFQEIDQCVAALLRSSLENNSITVIVTNAHKSWVDYSSSMLMPETSLILQQSVRVISAR